MLSATDFDKRWEALGSCYSLPADVKLQVGVGGEGDLSTVCDFLSTFWYKTDLIRKGKSAAKAFWMDVQLPLYMLAEPTEERPFAMVAVKGRRRVERRVSSTGSQLVEIDRQSVLR